MATTSSQRNILLIHLVRDEDTIRAASARLTDGLWNPQSETFELVAWAVARDNYKKTHDLTPEPLFLAEVKKRVASNYPSVGLTDTAIENAVRTIYLYPKAHFSYKLMAPILTDFLIERQTSRDVDSLLDPSVNQAAVIDRMHKAVMSSQIGGVVAEDLGALGFDVFKGMERTMTSFTPVDTLLKGIRLDECIGLLGPMKGGKTCFCQSLACDWIKANPDEHKVTYITYEEPTSAIWPKFLVSFADRFHRDKVEGKEAVNFDPDIVADMKRGTTMLDKRLTLIDMSGTRGQGNGGAAELATTIENFHKDGKLGQLVIVDHARLLLMSYMAANNIDESKQMRFEISNLCKVFKEVTDRCGVAGIMAHQMSAEGNRSHGRAPSHMDSSECKMFPEVFNQVVCLGVKDPTHDVATLNLSASRSLGQNDILVKIAGWKCRVEVAHGYSRDSSGRVISNEEADHGGTTPSETPGDDGMSSAGVDLGNTMN